ncbi:hypothetical protein Kirov_237 [Bacillus phage Kirov]|uniref:Uncharacterized protein n=1 Tax=Bacillus phage Kirov TaxID=2783539 RepID=A0A7U3NK08_9CAUD|nr:hypothetical protein PQE67_gp067 [Bacillus phage Kirov]QOV08436.1 hypothetical protein Kirov_237 [Bacillus phage Kirov]
MIMFQKEFDSYLEMIEYLSETRVDKANFEFNAGKEKWILNTVIFDW